MQTFTKAEFIEGETVGAAPTNVNLERTRVTDAEVKKLQAELPKLLTLNFQFFGNRNS